MLKRAMLDEIFVWRSNKAQNELVVSIDEPSIQFVLSLKRHPFQIRLHFRTRDRDVGLARVDAKPYHPNPDGSELRNQPHLHLYREGYGLQWAEAVDWYDVTKPEQTLEHFLEIVHTRFMQGFQLEFI